MNTTTQYGTILADPPWLERGGGLIKRGADRHYPLMNVEAIIDYLRQIPVAGNAHLYLWVTNNHLIDGLQVVATLGFRYVTNLVWVKDRFGLGQCFRGQHELLLFGVKGQPPYKREVTPGRSSCDIPSVILAKRREHSRKPDVQYSIIEATSWPPFIEAFARIRKAGWDAIGDEVPIVRSLDETFAEVES